MSTANLIWAFEQDIKPATRKFVLVILGDNCPDNGLAYPSTETICNRTGLDRKTVILCLDSLEKDGFIKDSSKRSGVTRQIKCYILNSGKSGMVSKAPEIPGKTPVSVPQDSPKRETELQGSSNELQEGTRAKKKGGFKTPTPEETKVHGATLGLPSSEAERFHAYYESNGWRVGKNPMKNWKAAMVTWRGKFIERGGKLLDTSRPAVKLSGPQDFS